MKVRSKLRDGSTTRARSLKDVVFPRRTPAAAPDAVQDSWHGTHVVITNWKDLGHPEAGGAELYCDALASAIARQGATVTYLTSRPKGLPAQEARDYGQVVRRGRRFTTYPRVLAWLAWNRRTVDAVIDSQNGIPYFSPLVVRRATPVSLVIHHVHQDQFDEYFPRPLSFVGKIAERQVTNQVYGRRSTCAVSPSTRDDVRARLRLRGPIFIAPNALSSHVTTRSSTGPSPGRERSENPSIVTVSRLVPHKRVHLLLASLPAVVVQHPDLSVHLIGYGEAMKELRDQAATLKLDRHVTFHGRLTSEDRDILLSTAWLSATTSAREGWGLAVLEAAAVGVPTVALSVPGLRDSIRDGITGRLVDDLSDFGATLSHTLSELRSAGVADEWAARCRAWAASFSWDSTAGHVLAVLRSEQRAEPSERRCTADVATIVTVARVGPAGSDRDQDSAQLSFLGSHLRRVDQYRLRNGAIELLLPGCDVNAAVGVRERLHLAGADLRPAIGQDLLGWDCLPIRAAPQQRHLIGHT